MPTSRPLQSPPSWHGLWPAMIVPFLSCLLYFVLLSGDPVAKHVYSLTKVFTVIWPLFWVVLVERRGFPRLDLRSSKHWKALPLGALTGGLLGALILLLYHTALGPAARSSAAEIREKVIDLGVLDHYILFAAFLSVLHSFIEEYYWRWFVFGGLDRLLGRWAALLLAALAFASHHYVVLSQFFGLPLVLLFGTCVGVGGAIWSLLYRRQGTLAGAWISHLLVDAAIMWIGYDLVF